MRSATTSNAPRRRIPSSRAYASAVPRYFAVSPAGAGRAFLLAHLILSPLLYSSQTTDAFELPKLTLLLLTALGLSGLGLCWAIAWVLRTPPEQRQRSLRALAVETIVDPVILGTLLLTLSAAVSTVFSPAPWSSLFGTDRSRAGLTTIVASAVLLLATRILCRSAADARRFLAAGVLAAAVLSTHALFQYAQLDPLRWDQVSTFATHVRPFATLGHANLLAAYLAMALPVTCVLARQSVTSRTWGAAAVLAGLVALSLAAVVLTLSRGVWLGLACAVLFLAILGRGALWSHRRTVVVAAALILAAGVLVLAVAGSRRTELIASLSARVRGLTEASSRREIWAAGLAICAERPLTGCGPDLFLEAFCPHRSEEYWHLEWNATPQRAHNEPIHVLATQGLPGGLALLVFTVGLVVAGRRAWRRTEGADRLLVGAACAAVLTFCVQNLFNFTMAGIASYFVTLAGVLSALGRGTLDSREQPGGGRRSSALFAFALIAGLLGLGWNANSATAGVSAWGPWWWGLAGSGAVVWVSLVWLETSGSTPGVSPRSIKQDLSVDCGIRAPRCGMMAQAVVIVGGVFLAWHMVLQPYRADLACREGEDRLHAGDDQALHSYRRAVELAPQQEAYWEKLAGAALTLAQSAISAEQRVPLLDEALAAMDQAERLSPTNGSFAANRARALAARALSGRSSPEEVLVALERAVRLDPRNACLLADAGFLLVGLKRPQEAQRYFEQGLLFDSDYARLRSGLGAVAVLEDRWEAAVQHFDATSKMEWHGQRKEQLDSLQTEALAYLAVGRLEQSERTARAVLEERPEAIQARLILARGLEVRGRRQEALAEYRRVLAVDPSHGPAGNGVRRLGERGTSVP